MRYEFFGKKLTYSGKTLWEIVGNLKNFGVGRLVKKSTKEDLQEPCFFKIIRVQALPPSREQFEERFVKAWVEEIYKGVNVGVRLITMTKRPKFKLIPKIEEEKYYKACEEMGAERNKKYIPKYCNWPPLYKMIWEKAVKKDTIAQKQYKSIPTLNTVINEYQGFDTIRENKTLVDSTCSLYKSEVSVEGMYKEIVKLKKLIKSNSEASK